MTDKAEGVTIHILDKEYMIACAEDERHDLLRSADYLDKKMREIRDSGKIIGSDRIAIMAALNIAHELLSQNEPQGESSQDFNSRLRNIQDKIDRALFESRQMEI